jgi:hypothetical protein
MERNVICGWLAGWQLSACWQLLAGRLSSHTGNESCPSVLPLAKARSELAFTKPSYEILTNHSLIWMILNEDKNILRNE